MKKFIVMLLFIVCQILQLSAQKYNTLSLPTASKKQIFYIIKNKTLVNSILNNELLTNKLIANILLSNDIKILKSLINNYGELRKFYERARNFNQKYSLNKNNQLSYYIIEYINQNYQNYTNQKNNKNQTIENYYFLYPDYDHDLNIHSSNKNIKQLENKINTKTINYIRENIFTEKPNHDEIKIQEVTKIVFQKLQNIKDEELKQYIETNKHEISETKQHYTLSIYDLKKIIKKSTLENKEKEKILSLLSQLDYNPKTKKQLSPYIIYEIKTQSKQTQLKNKKINKNIQQLNDKIKKLISHNHINNFNLIEIIINKIKEKDINDMITIENNFNISVSV